LFKAIDQKDISYFNSAYADLESPDIKNFSGDTVLTYAILLQKHEVVASILSKGANPNLANSLGYTPLNIAIEMLDSTSFNLLVNANADVNYIDGFGRTYLMHAARVGFLTGADLLIEKGVDVNAMDNDGFTALAIAYRHKRDLIVALLLKNGAKTWIEKSYDPKVESMMQELENRWNKN
jgi:ankyrin repeat protein